MENYISSITQKTDHVLEIAGYIIEKITVKASPVSIYNKHICRIDKMMSSINA